MVFRYNRTKLILDFRLNWLVRFLKPWNLYLLLFIIYYFCFHLLSYLWSICCDTFKKILVCYFMTYSAHARARTHTHTHTHTKRPIARHGKTGGSSLVRVGSIRFAGQLGRKSSRVELTRIFQISFFFFFLNRCNLSIVYEFLNCD